jgi:glutamate synthase domain-containing protein 2
LVRARRYLKQQRREDVTLIITGGLRLPADFAKAMCLGADGIALANSAIQAVGCVAARMCHTNNCPTGVATQKPELRARLDVENSAHRLARFLDSSVHLMQVLARACGHDHLRGFTAEDVTTWRRDMAELTGIHYAGLAE